MYSFKIKHIILCLLFIFINFSIYQECLASKYNGSGKYITEKAMNNVTIGMSKDQIYALLGSPTFVFTKNTNCLCYYYLYISKDSSEPIIYHYVMFFFDKNYLTRYKVFKF